MRMRVRTRGVTLTDDARRAIDRRVRLTLGRHAGGLDGVGVALHEVAHGVRCCVYLQSRAGEDHVVEAEAETVLEALERAANRAVRRLERACAQGWSAAPAAPAPRRAGAPRA